MLDHYTCIVCGEVGHIAYCATCEGFGETINCECCDASGETVDCGGTYFCLDCAKGTGWMRCDQCREWHAENDIRDDSDGRVCRGCIGRFEFIISVDGPHGMTWDKWAEIADLAVEMDFGCNFDCDGYCEASRKYASNRRPEADPYTCCVGCAGAYGYLEKLPVEAVEPVKALFDEKTGFDGPNGCRLPGKWRSSTCLGYRCHNTCRVGNTGVVEDRAWGAFGDLVHGWDHTPDPCNQSTTFPYQHGYGDITVETVRGMMQEAGVLKSEQLVQLV